MTTVLYPLNEHPFMSPGVTAWSGSSMISSPGASTCVHAMHLLQSGYEGIGQFAEAILIGALFWNKSNVVIGKAHIAA